jgi:hypothetical protein
MLKCLLYNPFIYTTQLLLSTIYLSVNFFYDSFNNAVRTFLNVDLLFDQFS